MQIERAKATIHRAVEHYFEELARLTSIPGPSRCWQEPEPLERWDRCTVRPTGQRGAPRESNRMLRCLRLASRNPLRTCTELERRALELTVCGRAAMLPIDGMRPRDESTEGMSLEQAEQHHAAWERLDRAGALDQKEIAGVLGLSVRKLQRVLSSARAKVADVLSEPERTTHRSPGWGDPGGTT